MGEHHSVPADLTGVTMPRDDSVHAIPTTPRRRFEVAEPLQIKLFVLKGQIAHRRVVDSFSHLDQLAQDLVSDGWLQPLETVVGRRRLSHRPEPLDLGLINVGQHLAPASIVAGVAEAESFDKLARTLIIFSRPNPDRVAAGLSGQSQRLVHDHRTMAAAAMIGMYDDTDPHQMQVVARRQIQHKHPDGVGSVLRYVEIVLWGIQIPAVTHLRGQHLRDRRERIGVIDLTRRLFDVGDCGDLAHVVRLDAYERHQTRVPHSARLSRHAIFETRLAAA